ncbi:MAG: ribosome small subunit-dependent GTPase A [Pirellulales bacterium]
MGKPRKLRVEFRKNRSGRQRRRDFTDAATPDGEHPDELTAGERLTGKGALTRHRTVIADEVAAENADGLGVRPTLEAAWRGRVLEVHGLSSFVLAPDGRTVRCVTRRLLKTLATDQRHVVAAGDWVHVSGDTHEGVILDVEPRKTSLSRTSRGKRHVIVANVDQVVIVATAAEPRIKPGLIDRLLVAAEANGIAPIICINKVDLVDPASLVPLAGVYARMGYKVILCSTVNRMGLARLLAELQGRVTAVVGQSGVGKSSLLNCIDPELQLRTAAVSSDNQKGKHTTTTARLIALGGDAAAGHVVDTPGIRQFQLWEFVPAEVSAAFRDLRPFANFCRYPDCTHTHESDCGVKNAVADGLLDTRRWESCTELAAGSGETLIGD